jgi:hypothetical protein
MVRCSRLRSPESTLPYRPHSRPLTLHFDSRVFKFKQFKPWPTYQVSSSYLSTFLGSVPFYTGSIQEFDSSSCITQYKQHLSTLSRIDHRRSLSALALALEQYERFKLSNQREDIDGAIVHLTESIHLLPLSSQLNGPMMIDTLSYFARELLQRSEVTKQPEKVVFTAKFLFHLRDRVHQIPSTSRHRVTEFLIHTLALQVALEAGNVMQNIREMAVLSRELLSLDTSDINTTRLILLLWGLVTSKSVWPFRVNRWRNLSSAYEWR